VPGLWREGRASPLGEGKCELTDTYQQYLAHWAKKLPWQEVAVSFRTSWAKVFHAVEYVVQWGLEHRELSGITAIEPITRCSDLPRL